MGIYLLVLGVICALGAVIEYGHSEGLVSTFLIGKKPHTVYRLDILWVAILLILIMFGGLRYGVGTDYDSYCTIFANIYEDWYNILYNGTERGYVWLNRILTLFTDDPQVVIFVTNMLISIAGVWCLKKYCRFAPFGLFIFFTTLYYYSFNLIRQGMAAAFVMIAFCLARDRKWVSSLVMCIVAALFHKTALLMVPVIFLMSFKYPAYVYFIFLSAAVLCTLLKDQITYFLISTFYPNNIGDTAAYTYDFSPTQAVLCAAYLVLCILYLRQMTRRNKGSILYLNFAVLIFTLYTFLCWIPMWSRLNLYFIGLYAFIVPEAVSCEEDRRVRMLYYGGLLAILLFFYMVPSLIGTDAYSYATVFSRPAEYLTNLYMP